jgi:cell fate (sporulation/competence/biofilm development) regulator YlbF (YheA/YmcA/DUF963 family)
MYLQLTSVKTDAEQAATLLGNLLCATPEYQAFLQAFQGVYDDPSIQSLSAQIHGHETAIQTGQDADGEHTVELTRLELELGDLPAVKEYHRAAKEIGALLRAVDEIISNETGIAFAVNAEQFGCACGG